MIKTIFLLDCLSYVKKQKFKFFHLHLGRLRQISVVVKLKSDNKF